MKIKPHILVIDDDRDDHFFIQRALKKVMPQASVTSLYDGIEGVDYLLRKGTYAANEDRLPDVIFLDINMPKMNGKVACTTIRKESSLLQIPIIILTTSSNPADKKFLLSNGANEYYIKPNDINEFAQIILEVKNKWLVKVSG